MAEEERRELVPSVRGRYFEEFEVGEEVVSFGRTITEADIVAFAGLTGDWNPLHTDARYAAGTMFGQRIAHGLLGLSIASGLAVRLGFMEGTVEAFLGLNWEFRAPIYIGDTICMRARVKEKKAIRRLGGGIITFYVEVLNQEGKVAQRGDWRVLVRSKPSEEA
ncbi:MAG: MaoC family dehydratase N-terminal domain-containing protein [Anaerolineae bacterium]|nr:MaoC family dehydratase N-terminal domain-containing protein [Anaerolineae bacterium]